MGFGEAVSTCFGKYLSFRGRAVRSEFWWWVVFVIIMSVIANFLDAVLGTRYNVSDTSGVYVGGGGWIATVVTILLFLPSVSVAVRRLHDTGKSGWWWWLNVICFVGWIILFIFYVTDTSPYENKYGPSSRAPAV